MPRSTHASVGNQSADLAARDGFPAQLHLGIHLHLKSHLPPELGQHIHVAGRLVSKPEIESFMHFARMQLLFQDSFGKLPRRHQREIAPEGKQQDRIYSGSLEPAEFLGSRSQQLQSSLGL
jgi:hypothetical protein